MCIARPFTVVVGDMYIPAIMVGLTNTGVNVLLFNVQMIRIQDQAEIGTVDLSNPGKAFLDGEYEVDLVMVGRFKRHPYAFGQGIVGKASEGSHRRVPRGGSRIIQAATRP